MENFNKIAIENFCDYLRIQTVQPNPDYSSCCKFLQRVYMHKYICQQLVPETIEINIAYCGA